MKIGDTFNPYKLFVGAFIPNCIMCLPITLMSSTEKLVWARLAQYAGENGKCYPKHETLSEEVGLSISVIQTALRNLDKNGFIKRIIATGKDRLIHAPNHYVFIWHSVFEQTASLNGSGLCEFNESGDGEFNESIIKNKYIRSNNNKKIYKKVLGDEGNINTSKKENIESFQKTEQLSADRKTLLPYIELFPREWQKESKFRTAWAEWVQHRKEIKKQLTELSTSKLVNKLFKLGMEKAIHEINRAIESGWQGIFPEKQQSKQTRPSFVKNFPAEDFDKLKDWKTEEVSHED